MSCLTPRGPACRRGAPRHDRLVHFHPFVGATHGLVRLAFQHHLGEFVLHLPGGGLGDPEAARQLEAGDARLRLGDQIDRLEPEAKRQVGGMEDSAGRQRYLVTAAAALVQPVARAAGRL